MAFSLWLGYLAAAVLIAASMSTGLRYGYWAALRVILGLQAAILAQLLVVAIGLGALLATSATAFDTVRFVGAAYLIWLGFQKWRAPAQEISEEGLPMVPKGLFLQGLLVNLSNPKAIIFIAALTPQFIDPARPQWPQFLIIALTMFSVDSVVMSCYALLASRLRRWLHDPATLKAQNRFFGGIFVGAGLLLATSARN